jgi:SAM-dependent methyltransferase
LTTEAGPLDGPPTRPAPAMTRPEFFLDEDAGDVEIANAQRAVAEWRWMSVRRDGTLHRALVLTPGERALAPPVVIGPDTALRCDLQPALETLSDDGLVVDIVFEPDGAPGGPETIVSMAMRSGAHNERSFTFDLAAFAGREGRLGIACDPGPHGDAQSDWLAVTNWVIGRGDRLGLLQARTHRRWRAENEVAHYSDVRASQFWAARSAREVETRTADAVVAHRPDGELPGPAHDLQLEALIALPEATPLHGDTAFDYAARVLQRLIGPKPPQFATRLRERGGAETCVTMLSLCSGAAGVERGIIADAGVPVDITLLDINSTLLEDAVASMQDLCSVRAIVADVNAISTRTFDRRFDIVACVSALHHVIELEHVLATASDLLAPDGELWIIGEAIGRNGNRLWPDALEAANRAFAALPERLRLNAATGQIDAVLPNRDYGASSFEGVRSSEIEAVLSDYFDPLHVYRRNCFLWRMIDATYVSNYDLTAEADRLSLLGLVLAEYTYWKRGGRPTESHSIYRPR